jgi:hypothetical protein
LRRQKGGRQPGLGARAPEARNVYSATGEAREDHVEFGPRDMGNDGHSGRHKSLLAAPGCQKEMAPRWGEAPGSWVIWPAVVRDVGKSISATTHEGAVYSLNE